ncbi:MULTISPECIES: TfoX/Sxy family protein [unclassified Microbacterium]|uniref:TfoX/Sxy family protein n=1 Tax=unclassified Microbacterium TaxID=2609290 RepID=UPI00214BB199|nr:MULTISPECIES: TfoX/Sxy family protein [unclassified Microbacterium]MCR2800470.1 TfoX/Sxy family protein [Microbacterium sp. zg.Y818]MCR2825797.1 TfoX/Sxy family protein [Microbacterium sp. zg.Y909]WIM22426.1 TfoX/Sxy family protein [Microbacterium sp. zg-Y818]
MTVMVDAARRDLLDRVLRRLPAGLVREVPMFGTIAVMFDGSMLVAARKDLGLLVHVSADEDADLVTRPEAVRAEMGPGRSMGPGWIHIHPDAAQDEGTLDFWVAQALRRQAG